MTHLSAAPAVLTAQRPTAFCAALAAEAEECCISRQCPHTAASIFAIRPLARSTITFLSPPQIE